MNSSLTKQEILYKISYSKIHVDKAYKIKHIYSFKIYLTYCRLGIVGAIFILAPLALMNFLRI